MNILMTTDSVGGVWTYCLNLCRALQAYGIEITVAVKGKVSKEQLSAAVEIPNVSVHVRDFKLEWMQDPWDDVRAAGEWLMELAALHSPDVVHLNDYGHGGLCWNAPVVMVGHSCVLSWIEAVRGAPADSTWNRYRGAVRDGLRSADLVVAPTEHMLDSLDRFYGPLMRKRVIFNGCDPNAFQPRAKESFIFAAGRFWDEAKNLETLSRAAGSIQWPIHVAGLAHPDGREGRFAGVHWRGALGPRAMADMYSRAAIFVNPAIYEPFGLTALEAALSGCALVLGDVPSLREVWGDAACYVAPRDPQQLGKAVNFLIEDPAFRDTLARRALERGSELSAERMGNAYVEAYHHAMAHHNATASQGGYE